MSKDTVIRKLLKALERGSVVAKENLASFDGDQELIRKDRAALRAMERAIQIGRAATAAS